MTKMIIIKGIPKTWEMTAWKLRKGEKVIAKETKAEVVFQVKKKKETIIEIKTILIDGKFKIEIEQDDTSKIDVGYYEYIIYIFGQNVEFAPVSDIFLLINDPELEVDNEEDDHETNNNKEIIDDDVSLYTGIDDISTMAKEINKKYFLDV